MAVTPGFIVTADTNTLQQINEVASNYMTETWLQSELVYMAPGTDLINVLGTSGKMEEVSSLSNSPKGPGQATVHARQVALNLRAWHYYCGVDARTEALSKDRGSLVGTLDYQMKEGLKAASRNVDAMILATIALSLQTAITRTIDWQTTHSHYEAVDTPNRVTTSEFLTQLDHINEHGGEPTRVIAGYAARRRLLLEFGYGPGMANPTFNALMSKMDGIPLVDNVVLFVSKHMPADYYIIIGEGMNRPPVAMRDLIPVRVESDMTIFPFRDAEIWHDYAMALHYAELCYICDTGPSTASTYRVLTEASFKWLGTTLNE